ncbi:MAG: hypothetical protein GF383_10240 [Candidatus Lokiarchaeota archaeon]|nr:hypothetical protein [Candidatus Lokiarchaeota archaeon]
MNINPRYVIYHDLIGFKAYAKLVSAPERSEFVNIGKVIDETSNMLITKKNIEIKKYIKKDHVFRFKMPSKRQDQEDVYLEVLGTKIEGRPENRLRNLRKRRLLRR